MPKKRKRFPGICADDYRAETDAKATSALERVPLLPKVVHKFHELGYDRWMYCWNMAMSVRCGPRQFGSLHKVLQECCAVLDMPEPELYVTTNPFPNAFAGGLERPYLVVRSSLIDSLDDEQLYHLIGHELGHIQAGHVLYHSIGNVLIPLMEALGRRTFGLGDAFSLALAAAFMEWSRQAELTADRAGMLCTQDFRTSAATNLVLCGGGHRLRDEASVDAFLEQSRTYQDMTGLDNLGKMLVFLTYGLQTTHPMPVHRTRELERWHEAGGYEDIVHKFAMQGSRK
ncbi:MAG: M48 family metallopeptidase [Fimbriimonadaceae bacterium]|nr:M48 family metallopeptidase [Fimbriimonadaceae bacterium]